MFGLVDCNNFFVSCELVFNPSLIGKPVVVLSSNDGCVISRSYEAKALGIPMGCPAFKIKDHTDPRPVVMLSGRHKVYSAISHRVMMLLASMAEKVEVYSVDEAFFAMPYDDDERNLDFAKTVAHRIYHEIGVSVSVGVAKTRTLAKIASHEAKKQRTLDQNAFVLTNPQLVEQILRATPIRDVWGIGRRSEDKMHFNGVATAWDFTKMVPAFVKKLFSITGLRTQRELLGESCVEASPITAERQTITSSRTFSKSVATISELREAVISFAGNCALTLRQQHMVAENVMVWISGDRFAENAPFYSNSCDIRLATASSSSMELCTAAAQALCYIFRPGFQYKKAGVTLSRLHDACNLQLNLFDKVDHGKQNKLMSAIDKINSRYSGKKTIGLVPELAKHSWTPSQAHQIKAKGAITIRPEMIGEDINKYSDPDE